MTSLYGFHGKDNNVYFRIVKIGTTICHLYEKKHLLPDIFPGIHSHFIFCRRPAERWRDSCRAEGIETSDRPAGIKGEWSGCYGVIAGR